MNFPWTLSGQKTLLILWLWQKLSLDYSVNVLAQIDWEVLSNYHVYSIYLQ